MRHDWGTGRFHDARDRFGGSTANTRPPSSGNPLVLLDLAVFESTSVGVFFPRRTSDRASDTPVASRSFLSGFPPSRARRASFLSVARAGWSGERVAKATFHTAS